MATNLLSSIFSATAPQRHLKKFWEVGVRSKSVDTKAKVKKEIGVTEKARQQKYRSRSAYKLIYFDEKYKLLGPGLKVLDIGAAPGSWSEYLAGRTNANQSDSISPKGLVIAVDTKMFSDIDGVKILPNTDFVKLSSQKKILEYLNRGQKFDFILSDMTADGIKDFNEERLMKLAYCVVLFSLENLKPGGGVLIKVWDDAGTSFFKSDMKKVFGEVKFDGYQQRKISFSDNYFIGTNFLRLR